MNVRVIEGDCLAILPTLEAGSVDAVVTDPPYPEIDRAYGRWTEAEWWDLIMGVVAEVRRVLKPTGSAVFILQANSRKVGSMRGWLWEFMAWVCREWNMVQDAWWWNYTAITTLAASKHGMMRPAVKACVWAGPENCYRAQDAVLWRVSDHTVRQALSSADRWKQRTSSGHSMNRTAASEAAIAKGGSTPYNLLPVSNARGHTTAGAHGHGAGTPLALCRWWTRYICPPGDTILDPFAGSGTTGIAALREGCRAVLIEREPAYCDIIRRRIEAEQAECPLFAGKGAG